LKIEALQLLEKANRSLSAAWMLLEEEHFDFAASRAYYSLFYTAEALLLQRGKAFSSHGAVIAAFGKEFARSGEVDARFHRYLIDAQDLRNLSDYEVGMPVEADQVKQLLGWAREFISMAEELIGN
jgi:uncharacterized protein (UPF0332 family)